MDRFSAHIPLDQVLSKCESRVARHIAWGYTKKETAEKLFISEHTASAHLRNIYSKLGICKETDLCRVVIFDEYSIADSPMKKAIAVIFLVISIMSIMSENNMVRVFRNVPARQVTRVVRPSRARRYENVFALSLALS